MVETLFKAEDSQLSKIKKTFIDNMWEVQKQLKEVAILQKNRDG